MKMANEARHLKRLANLGCGEGSPCSERLILLWIVRKLR